MRVALRTLAA